MTTSQITGSTRGIVLTGARYTNPVTVIATATVLGSSFGLSAASAWAVQNFGQISAESGAGIGVDLTAGGSVTNGGSGFISGYCAGVYIGGASGTVDNSGTMVSNLGVSLVDGGAVTNTASGVIFGVVTGVYISSASGSVDNSGDISGNIGVALTDGGLVTNAASASISGANAGITVGAASGAVDNYGDIIGSSLKSVGVALFGGSVTNAASGSITGALAGVTISGAGTVENGGAIRSGAHGVGVALRSGLVTNASSGKIVGASAGVTIRGRGTVDNAGSISGSHATGVGVALQTLGFVSNSASGSITGGAMGVSVGAGSGVVENAGVIGGGTDAVYFAGTHFNRLIVDAGAVFNGDVVANAAGNNTLELTATTGPATLTGLGSQFQGFETLVFDAGANWTVAGSFSGVKTIGGFHAGDTLDLTGIAYSAGDMIELAAGNRLEILDSGSNVLWSVELKSATPGDADYSGKTFQIASDGGGGTDVTLSPASSTIRGRSGGIYLTSASYTDPVTVTGKSTISGGAYGLAAGSAWTILNSGQITASAYQANGIDLHAGGSVTNTASGVIGGVEQGVAIYGAAGTVRNAGSIAAVGLGGATYSTVGVYLAAGGLVANGVSGIIAGYNVGASIAGASGTIDNSGTIVAASAGGATFGTVGVYLAAGGSVANAASGLIGGYDFGVVISGAAGTVDNDGTILAEDFYGVLLNAGGAVTNGVSGLIAGPAGVFFQNTAAGAVYNAGTIVGFGGGDTDFAGVAVFLGLGGSVTNAASGYIAGSGLGGAITAHYGAAATIDNSGTIVGAYGIQFEGGGGLVSNAASGLIQGYFGGAILKAGVTLDNAGRIIGTHGDGLSGDSGLFVSNAASGTISGQRWGIWLDAGTATNTVENAGTISGGTDAIYSFQGRIYGSKTIYGALRLIVDPGAVFNGNVVTNKVAQNTLELAGTATAPATLTGVGSQFQGFQTLVFDAGANWTVAGSFSGVKNIDGFHSGDTLDLTGVVFSAADSVELTAGNVLEVLDGGNKVLWSARLEPFGTPGFSGKTFHIASDGGGGTDVTLSPVSSRITGANHGIYLSAASYADPVTVVTLAKVTGGDFGLAAGSAWTIRNSGQISGSTGYGIDLKAGGSVTNSGSGVIAGYRDGVRVLGTAGAPAVVSNAGSITGVPYGVDILGAAGAPAMLSNSGTIGGVIDGVYILGAAGAPAMVSNSGAIAGTYDNGVVLGGGGSVTNAASGLITGYYDAITFTGGAGAVDNAGTLIGGDQYGIHLSDGGSVSNAASGSIAGGGVGVQIGGSGDVAADAGYRGGVNNGVQLAGGDSVTNAASGSIVGGDDGIDIYAILGASGGRALVANAGSIVGEDLYGIHLWRAGTVTNAASGSITGYTDGVRITHGSGTVENAGTITGGTDAVYFTTAAPNRLIVDAGAVFNGDVVANAAGNNTLELKATTAPATLAGVGSQFQGFQTLRFDIGAEWTVAGSLNGTTTIAGFAVGDTIDLTNLTYTTGDTISLATGNVLEILDSGNNVLWSAQLTAAPPGTGKYASKTFQIADDGVGGTDITFQSAGASPADRRTALFAQAIAGHGSSLPPFADLTAPQRLEGVGLATIAASLHH